MSRLMLPVFVVVIVVAGAVYMLRPAKQTLGTDHSAHSARAGERSPENVVQTTPIGELSAEHVGQTVRIEGIIDKQCPHTGCWAIVRDDTGTIRIDTQKGGFTLPLRREGSRVTVTGVLEQKDGGSLEISATSAEL